MYVALAKRKASTPPNLERDPRPSTVARHTRPGRTPVLAFVERVASAPRGSGKLLPDAVAALLPLGDRRAVDRPRRMVTSPLTADRQRILRSARAFRDELTPAVRAWGHLGFVEPTIPASAGPDAA